jgi:putative hydrolase of the HAD superfamily
MFPKGAPILMFDDKARRLPRAILFDLDDTIISAYGQRDAVWAAVCARFAADLVPHRPHEVAAAVCAASDAIWNDPVQHKAWRGRLLEARRHIVVSALAQLAGAAPADPSLADTLAATFTAQREAAMHVFPGARETLDRLKALGVRLALVTNGAAEAQRGKLERFALERHFDHIQIEGEHGFGKPEERAYTHAMAALGVAPHETWMVGDNLEWEVVAPQRLGIHAIWYDGAGIGMPAGSPIRPDRIVRSLPELLPADGAMPKHPQS